MHLVAASYHLCHGIDEGRDEKDAGRDEAVELELDLHRWHEVPAVQHPPQRRPRRHVFVPSQIKQDVIDVHIAQAGSSSPPQTLAPTLTVLLVLHEHRIRVRGAAGGIRLPLEAGAFWRRNEGEEASTYAQLSDTSPNQSARACYKRKWRY
jgi:hypothetical protein